MVNRITNLGSSGIDVQSVVTQLMQAQQPQLDSLNQQKQLLEWEQEDFRTINSKILDLRNTAFNMKLQSPYLAKTTSSADTNTVSATAGASANVGNYSVKVKQLATSAMLTSSSSVNAASSSSALNTIGMTAGTSTSLTISGAKGSATVSVNDTDTIDQFVSKVNSQTSLTGVSLNFDSTMNQFFFVSTTTGSTSKIQLDSTNSNFLSNVLKVAPTQGVVSASTVYAASNALVADSSVATPATLQVAYGGAAPVSFTVDQNTTVASLVNQINNSSIGQSGVTAYWDQGTGQLKFNNKDNTKTIDFTGTTATLATKMGLPAASGGTIPTGGTIASSKFYTITDANGNTVPSTSQLIDGTITAAQDFRINYDGKDYDFTIDQNTTIGSLITNINSSGLGKDGVDAYLDSTSGQLKIFNADTSKKLTLSDQTSDSYDAVSALGLTTTPTSGSTADGGTDTGYNMVSSIGQDAIVNINNNTIDAVYSSNTFTFSGITFTAKRAQASTEQPINVAVTMDVDTIYNSIKSFVDKYNDTLSTVNSKLSEARYYDFAPLTDAQKSSMNDTDITNWTAKARSGLLDNDTILENTASNFRYGWMNTVSGQPGGNLDQMSQIGITTGSYLEQGKLYIDEATLRQAIADHPDQVAALFTADDGNSNTSNSDGLATRLYNEADGAFQQITAKAGADTSALNTYQLGLQIQDLDTRISTTQDQFTTMENRYYDEFNAMNSAVTQMNDQYNSFLSQLNGK
jgi:flagellar hook-associated protein 2